MKPGKVENYINDKITREGGLILSVMDTGKVTENTPEISAKAAEEAGVDILLMGGSTGVHMEELNETIKRIKENCSLPVVIFPGNVVLTNKADAVFFMNLINSGDNYWNSTVQILGSVVAKKINIESIPTGLVILEPGMTVGWITNARLVPRSKPELAAASALACEYTGSRLVILESGSGAPEPASKETISAVRKTISIPFFYGGGIRTPEQAYATIKAGADGVFVGTAIESGDMGDKLKSLVTAVKKAGKEKI